MRAWLGKAKWLGQGSGVRWADSELELQGPVFPNPSYRHLWQQSRALLHAQLWLLDHQCRKWERQHVWDTAGVESRERWALPRDAKTMW